MSQATAETLTLDDLANLLRAAAPDAVFAPPRVLRRLIRARHPHRSVGLRAPHGKSLVVKVGDLRGIVDPTELGLDPAPDPARRLVLLERPSSRELVRLSPGSLLHRYWRRIFHGLVHDRLERLAEAGRLDERAVLERIGLIGPGEYEDARIVLDREHMLLRPVGEVSTYIEFAATFLELSHLAPGLLPAYFPAFDRFDAVASVLESDLDAAGLAAACRPEGADDPAPAGEVHHRHWEDDEDGGPELPAKASVAARLSEGRYQLLLAAAGRAAELGNDVRTAILLTHAERSTTPARAGQARSMAKAALDRLAGRLASALGLGPGELARWRVGLRTLREGAARRVWSAEARLLYDLQAVCLDHEREIYETDLVEWALSLGRRSLRRSLPHQREVAAMRHLRRASRRLRRVRLPEEGRNLLADLLEAAIEGAEEGLRVRFRPLIARALDLADLLPRDLPERVARSKIEEELLDRLVDRGFLAAGDVRDALSRNGLKLPDLTPSAFFRGDRLLRTDRRLGVSLDGVYRRAEFYFRGLQKASSLAFGTPLGRWLTLLVVLPFGGAFVSLEGVQHVIDPLVGLFAEPTEAGLHGDVPASAPHGPDDPDGPPPEAHHGPKYVHLVNAWTIGLLGLLLLGLINHAGFRAGFVRILRDFGRAVRFVLVRLPGRLMEWAPLRAIFESRAFALLRRWVLEPLAVAVIAALPTWRIARSQRMGLEAGILAFVAATILLNSRFGRDLREEAVERLHRGWSHLVGAAIPAIYHAVMGFFARVVEEIDRALYAVDEWLRFRAGESRLSLAAKAIGGAIWAGVSYVVRFCINLLVEPQINPIKHFPVVTVSHKVLAPILYSIIYIGLQGPLGGPKNAATVYLVVQFLLPGVFGFLVWELKENWRLYDANRPKTLKPVIVGHHGETLSRLLRPGFHAGTLPKIYDRLRRATRRARPNRRPRALVRAREDLHHVELDVRHFVEREFVAYARESPTLRGLELDVTGVETTSARIEVELGLATRPGGPWRIAFEERSGRLVAGTVEPGWISDLEPDQARALAFALAGLEKLAGVDLVREQLREALRPEGACYRLVPGGLLAWIPGDPGPATWLELDGEAGSAGGRLGWSAGPALDRSRLQFGRTPISWREWVEAWRRDESGLPIPPPPTGPVLPATPEGIPKRA